MTEVLNQLIRITGKGGFKNSNIMIVYLTGVEIDYIVSQIVD